MKTLLQPRSRLLLRGLALHREDGRPRALTALLEPLILVGFMAVFGLIVVPSHWTSIWMDREFTGWVTPLANRLGQGMMLYADGGHIPMPPLPFVLLHVLTRGRAIWLTESFCNFLFQALTLVTMYLALRPLLRRPVPFLATLAAIPIFFSLPKTIVYDSMAQFHVALLGALLVWHHRATPVSDTMLDELRLQPHSPLFRPSLILMGLVTASCLLSKQSTGTGACLGVMLALVCFSTRRLSGRLREALAFAAWTAVLFAVLLAVLSPWMRVDGLIEDVFLTGSEPKGGSLRLVRSLGVYAAEIAEHGILALIPIVIAVGALRISLRSARAEVEETKPGSGAAYLVALLVPLFALALAPVSERLVRGAGAVAIEMLWVGLLVGLLGASMLLVPSLRARLQHLPNALPLACLGTLLFVAAAFHSLSTPHFRWIYDNNPLIVFAGAITFTILLDFLGTAVPGSTRRHRLAAAAVLAAALFFPWASSGAQLAACKRCRQAWPEISYLAGARMTDSARGMRKLVALVRELAPDSDADSALLLPSDPNVEAWFERPRPRLSAPIIFADQYWGRYVDRDVAAIREQLPRVIVIGPQHYWRAFHRIWQRNYGAERLIDAVRTEILPEHYALHKKVAIRFQGRRDHMDVYVRKE